jgi:hypothetical protein
LSIVIFAAVGYKYCSTKYQVLQVLSRTSPGTVSFVVSWIGSLAYLNNYMYKT